MVPVLLHLRACVFDVVDHSWLFSSFLATGLLHRNLDLNRTYQNRKTHSRYSAMLWSRDDKWDQCISTRMLAF